jgi:hypothetical protein
MDGDGDEARQEEQPRFNPQHHLTKLSGKDYLEVKWRIAWLRDAHPDASIVTELVRLDTATSRRGETPRAVFRADVTLSGGRGHATGWGSETEDDFKDYIEKAETKAIGRAIAALGFGTQFAVELEGDAPNGLADSPVASTARPRPTQQAIRPTPTAPASQAQTKGAITQTQRDIIGKLISNLGESPADFAEQLDGMSVTTAMEWIKKLRSGEVPWKSAQPGDGAPPTPAEQSDEAIRLLLKLDKGRAEQHRHWDYWINAAGKDVAKWRNLVVQLRQAMRIDNGHQKWRYLPLISKAPDQEILNGLYKAAQADDAVDDALEQAMMDRITELVQQAIDDGEAT